MANWRNINFLGKGRGIGRALKIWDKINKKREREKECMREIASSESKLLGKKHIFLSHHKVNKGEICTSWIL